MAHTARLTGIDWQDWATKLLCCHYGPTEFQRVSDRDRGDAGLEGFTRTAGHAYQAYGCIEPLATKDRYEKQRDKMTEDIDKFINNHVILKRLLGTIRISRWALLVPFCDSKEIVAHAAVKTKKVIDAGLTYVADSFHVCVCTEEDFVEERDRLLNAAVRTIEIEPTAPTPQQIADWAEANQQPSTVLAEKLNRLTTLRSDANRRQFQTTVLDWYLRGQDILDALRQHPDVYAKVQKAKSHHEAYLAATIASGLASHELLNATLTELKATLQAEVRELHSFSSRALAHEAVADWLLRCPLDFPEVVDA